MINSYPSFRRPLRALPSSLVIIFFIIALLGFADAAYLTAEHYLQAIPPCTTGFSCATVLTSSYSTIAGIPVSLLGAFYYLVICIGVFAYLESKHVAREVKAHHHAILKGALCLTVLGFLMSLWFLYLQAFVIHSFCEYCIGSALTSTLLFIIALVIFIRDARAPTI
jgi:uncharacterized membrane protein